MALGCFRYATQIKLKKICGCLVESTHFQSSFINVLRVQRGKNKRKNVCTHVLKSSSAVM